MMAYWIEPTIVLAPFAAWMFLGVGLPWALALLPRALWRDRLTVIAVALALGPLGLTAVMFVLGTAGRITLAGTLIGSAALALIGAGIAWWGRDEAGVFQSTPPLSPLHQHDARGRGNRLLRARFTPFSTTWGNGPGDRGKLVPDLEHTPYAAGVEGGQGGRTRWSAFTRGWLTGETVIVAGMVIVLLGGLIVAAYWPFLAYDPLWVYGYNAKIFVMQERIPDTIGYYPQLIPLTYTYLQQAWGGIDDHAARAALPWFNMAAVLMAYVLGRRAFDSRRVGLLAAATWAFYPHAAAWAGAGDLEITLTLYTTGAAAFFVEAWRTGNRRAAVLSGVLLGGALWTKPTAGGLALGIMLVSAGWIAWKRLRPAACWPRLRLVLIMGLAAAPLGGMWYLRNLALGHNPVDFPADYWHDFAQRSGQELGWPLLIAILIAGGLLARPPAALRRWPRPARIGGPLLALVLLLIGILPTALNLDVIGRGDAVWYWARGDLSAGGRLSAAEWALIGAGFALLAGLGRSAWQTWDADRRGTILVLWGLLLPYGLVWFLNFSYHYRLSFAIVPLVGVQVAALIDGWLWPWLAATRPRRVLGVGLILAAAGLALAVELEFTVKHGLGDGLPDDRAKYDVGNPALMTVVHRLEEYAAQHGQPVVAAPGEDRLPFFFPTWDIRNSRDPEKLPTRLEDLAGVDVYITGSVADFLAQRAGLWPNSLVADVNVGVMYHQRHVIAADGAVWPTVLQPIPLHITGAAGIDDGNFRYLMFTLHPEARTQPLNPGARRADTVIIGGFAQFLGHDMVNLLWQQGQMMTLTLYWIPTEQAPPPRDYRIVIELLDAQGKPIAQWEGEPLLGQYATRYWRPGESLLDYWPLHIPEGIPPGPARLRIGLMDPATGERLPVTLDGAAAGDSVLLETRIEVG